MKFLFSLIATFLFTLNTFAACPDDLVGTYARQGDSVTVAVDAKTKVVTFSGGGLSFSAPANGVKTLVPMIGATFTVILSCSGDKLEQQSFDSSHPNFEITSEYFLDVSKNLVIDDPRTPNSSSIYTRQSDDVDCSGGPEILLQRKGCGN